MWMNLALAWGCPVREAQTRCTHAEFLEWCAFYSIQPWGEERADLRIAQLCSIVANVAKGKKGRPFKPSEFMPRFGPARQNAKAGFAALTQAMKVHNATKQAMKNGNNSSKSGRKS